MIEKIRDFYLPAESDYPIRKATVIAHWFYGAICAYLLTVCVPLSFILLAIFGVWEFWQDYNMLQCDSEYSPEGAMDWWDAFVVFISGLVLILTLSPFGITALKW